MKFNIVGKTDIQISEIGLGTWQIAGDDWGKKENVVSMCAIHAALDAGINHIDTAAGYGSGHSERLIGQVLKERMRKVIRLSLRQKYCRNVGNGPHRRNKD